MERGMELHRNSLVVDAYGFAPFAAEDGDAIKAAIEAGASDIDVGEMIEDMRMTRWTADPVEREEFLEAWDAAGVTCIFQNAGEECQSPLRIMKRLAHYTYVTDVAGNYVRKAATPEDIAGAAGKGARLMYLTVNGVPLPQAWNSVEEELMYIRIFFHLGVRMMHLTYNRRNMIGDGCAEPANGGLSDFGRAVVREMNRVGVIVDVAHCGWRTSLEAARASSKPIVASHTACLALNEHVRCKPDEVIRAIADTGGYIGICCVPAFLGRSGDISAMLDHVDYAARKFGVDHVAIGTDRAHHSSRESAERRKIPDRRKRRKEWQSLWPPNEPLFDEKWNRLELKQCLAWTNWPLFTVGLVQRGYSDDDICKIIGGNALRVATEVFAASRAGWK
jgi:membrane dipeptidase